MIDIDLVPFETWARPYGFDLERSTCHCCHYKSEVTQAAFMGYIGGYNACTDDRDAEAKIWEGTRKSAKATTIQ